MKKYQQLAVILILGLSLMACKDISVKDPASLPVAVDDTATTTENSAAIDVPVLSNDTSSGNLDISSIEIITSPQQGTATATNTGEVQYLPNSNYYGTDSFIYTVKDTDGNFSNPATVTVTVTRTDNPPTITIGVNPITIKQEAQITDAEIIAKAQVTATDDIDNSVNIQIATNNIDTSTAGPYQVTFSATDSANQTTISASLDAIVVASSTKFEDHLHTNCLGGITTIWYDMNLDGVLDPNEIESVFPSYGGEADPILIDDLKDMINNNINVKDVNTCEIENMSLLFKDKTNFNDDISNWNTGSVTNMASMFHRASAFNGDIGNWDVSSVENMDNMFQSAASFTDGNIGAWGAKVANVRNMSRMFNNAGVFNGDIGAWGDSLAKVQDMLNMFANASTFNGDISAWDVSSVENMSGMFFNASAFNGDIGAWDVSSVENMTRMFQGATSFTNGNIGAWGHKVANVENMSNMFYRASAFNANIGDWNVNSVTDMSYMFQNTRSFTGGNIGNWKNDLGNWDNMSYIFYNASSFNADIGDWNMNSVKNMRGMFRGATTFTDGNIGNWKNNNGNWDNMIQMFYRASAFNGDISDWNVSSVTNMEWMFLNASVFGQNISGWDVGKVGNMKQMFGGVTLPHTIYDQILIGWDILSKQARDKGSPWVSRVFDGGSSVLSSSDGFTSRSNLINREEWSITDGTVIVD